MFYKGPRPIKYSGNILMAINGLYNGRYYNRSEGATGTYSGTYYVNGDPATGIYGGIYYNNGLVGTGTYGGIYYVNGTTFTGYTNNNYYNNGNQVVSDGSRTWNLSANLINMRQATSILLDDGRILFTGGTPLTSSNYGLAYTDKWEIHDPAQNFSVTETGTMPLSVRDVQLLKLSNGKIVCIGGEIPGLPTWMGNNDTNTTTYIFDPQTSQWSTSVSLDGINRNSTIGNAFRVDVIPGTNKVIFSGGNYQAQYSFQNTYFQDVYIIDYDNNTLTQKTSIPVPNNVGKYSHTGNFLPDGTYIIGEGSGSGVGNSNTAASANGYYSYNVTTDTWQFLTTITGNSNIVGGFSFHISNLRGGTWLTMGTDAYGTNINAISLTATNYALVYPHSQGPTLDSGENFPDGTLFPIMLSSGNILVYGRNSVNTANGLIGIYYPLTNEYEMLDSSNLANPSSTRRRLMLLSNNKLVAYDGVSSYTVMDF